jgi:hypothetical protein
MHATDFLRLGGTLLVGLRPQSMLGYKINYSVASYRVVALSIYIARPLCGLAPDVRGTWTRAIDGLQAGVVCLVTGIGGGLLINGSS